MSGRFSLRCTLLKRVCGPQMWNSSDACLQSRQGHAATLSSQYLSTASSAQKSTDTFTESGLHMNCSRNSISMPFSFNRENTISKRPEVVAQRDASTDKTAVHFRSSVGGRISENRTSLNAKAGLHVCWATACITLTRPIPPVSSPNMHDRNICRAVC
jgi:hypothetical protein